MKLFRPSDGKLHLNFELRAHTKTEVGTWLAPRRRSLVAFHAQEGDFAGVGREKEVDQFNISSQRQKQAAFVE